MSYKKKPKENNKLKKNSTSFDFGNTASEKWTYEMTKDFFEKALDIAKKNDIYWIGDIAVQLNTYNDIFTYLSDKFPDFRVQYQKIKDIVLSRLNKGALLNDLNATFAKFHISSNYNWSEKNTTENKTEITTNLSSLTTDELVQRAKAISKLSNE